MRPADVILEPKTMAEAWSLVDGPPLDRYIETEGRASCQRGNADFRGTASFAEALRLGREGWPEGLRKMRAMVSGLDDKIARLIGHPEPVFDVVGECPDVGAFLSGEPEHMVRFEPGEGDRRIVRLVYNFGAPSAVESEVLMRRGAVACAVADGIEQAGLRCEVVLAKRSISGTAAVEAYFPFKRAEEPLNLDRLAFAFANPAFMRRIWFRVLERIPNAGLRRRLGVGDGYGQTEDVPAERRGDLYFPGLRPSDEHTWLSPAKSERYLMDALRTVGVDVKEEA